MFLADMFKNYVMIHSHAPWEALQAIDKGGAYHPHISAEFGQRNQDVSAAVIVFKDGSISLFTMVYTESTEEEGPEFIISWDCLSWPQENTPSALNSYLKFIKKHDLPTGPNEVKARKAIKGLTFHTKKRDLLKENAGGVLH